MRQSGNMFPPSQASPHGTIPQRRRARAAGPLAALLTLAWAVSTPGAPALTNITFVGFDTETTGLKVKQDRVVEISAVKFLNGVIIAATNWLVNPGIEIPPEATRVHGITTEMVRDKPPIQEVISAFLKFCGKAPLIAHNARYDVSILQAEAHRHNFRMPTNTVFDTLALTRRWFPDSPTHRLESLAAYLSIPPVRFHRAQTDTEVMVAVFDRGVKQMGPGASLEDLGRLSRVTLLLGANPPRRRLHK